MGVGQGVRLGGEILYLREKSGNLQVVDHHVSLGVCVQDESVLLLLGKMGGPDEPLALRLLVDAPHTCARGVCCAFPGRVERV